MSSRRWAKAHKREAQKRLRELRRRMGSHDRWKWIAYANECQEAIDKTQEGDTCHFRGGTMLLLRPLLVRHNMHINGHGTEILVTPQCWAGVAFE